VLHPHSARFERLSAAIAQLPVIDCHEHMFGPAYMAPIKEPIAALICGYVKDDLRSAGASQSILRMLQDDGVPTERKWPVFEPLWQRVQHTAYGRVTRLILQDVYRQPAMSLAALHAVGEQLAARDEAFYERTLDEANIRAIIADVLVIEPGDLGAWLRGEQDFPPRWRLTIPLPLFHAVYAVDTAARDWAAASSARDWPGVQLIGSWADRDITSLDEFLEAAFEVFSRAKRRGAVGFKDQCAYMRSLDYEVVAHSDAERLFNQLLSNPRAVLGWPEAKPLDDYLFHAYMRFARELDLPVQVHTGHMAGIYNRVDKANAAHLAGVLELHRSVRFDLIHANWPYDGDILFLAKNYPNVRLDCTWLHIIDPLYARDLLKRALVCVPHTKVHGFGGDYHDMPEYSAAHLKIARQVIAGALCDMVEAGWLEETAALDVAADWLFNNPNAFWRLGFAPVQGSQ
jgi:hypothetical protein